MNDSHCYWWKNSRRLAADPKLTCIEWIVVFSLGVEAEYRIVAPIWDGSVSDGISMTIGFSFEFLSDRLLCVMRPRLVRATSQPFMTVGSLVLVVMSHWKCANCRPIYRNEIISEGSSWYCRFVANSRLRAPFERRERTEVKPNHLQKFLIIFGREKSLHLFLSQLAQQKSSFSCYLTLDFSLKWGQWAQNFITTIASRARAALPPHDKKLLQSAKKP